MNTKVDNINKTILRQCREQMGYCLSDAKKWVKTIEAMEHGKRQPTWNQLDKLSKRYQVPRWVFCAPALPPQYQFEKSNPAFRQFADSEAAAFKEPKVRYLTAKVGQLRSLMLELQEDNNQPALPFEPPTCSPGVSAAIAAQHTRAWLGVADNVDFVQWRAALEDKGVFVFTTGKYQSWSKIEPDGLRGLAIYHEELPIIIINSSDVNRAQSFTLFHELGHLLKAESNVDDWGEAPQHRVEERWCDEFAGNVLMPPGPFGDAVSRVGKIEGFDMVDALAGIFKVSSYACLVRLRQLNQVDQTCFDTLNRERIEIYKKNKERSKKGRAHRNLAKEKLNQYGRIYTNTIFQSYYNKAIGLHRLCQLFDLKKASYALQLGGLL